MFADIVPALAAAAGIPPAQADAEFTQAYQAVQKARGGVADSRTFWESVLLFRAKRPFAFGDLHHDRKTYAAQPPPSN